MVRFGFARIIAWLLALSGGGIAGCKPSASTAVTVGRQAAYGDGFEVVVVTGGPSGGALQCVPMPLVKGEEAVTRGNGATFLIPPDQVEAVRQALVAAGVSPRVEAVGLKVEGGADGGQVVDVSFHYSKQTYHYCYQATAMSVTPLWSSYADLARESKTTYVPDGGAAFRPGGG